jgi:hypothetical protein
MVLLMTLNLSACSTWQATELGPRQVIEAQPSRVRVTDLDGDRTVILYPAIDVDSIRGHDHALRTTLEVREGALAPVAILAITDVQAIEVRRFSAPRTLGLVLAGLLVLGAVGLGSADYTWDASGLSGW